MTDLEGDLVDLADLEGDLVGVLMGTTVTAVPTDGALVDLGDLDDLSEHLLLLLLLLLLLTDGAGLLVPADGDLVDLLLRFRPVLLPLPADGALLDLTLGEQVGAAARAWRTSPHLVRS